MIYIYQIGRLERNLTKNLTFKIASEQYESSLSSFALKNHLSNLGHDVKVIMIYPVSLPFNRALLNDTSLDSELRDKIGKIINDENEKKKYLEDPRSFFEIHPHVREADDFIVVHSIGKYENIEFETQFDDIVLEIFADMVERISCDEDQKIYIDISSGHNIYIGSLLEAVRYFATFFSLTNWNEKKIELYLVFSEPIRPDLSEVNVYIDYELKYKYFFSSPIKSTSNDPQNLSSNIFKGESRNRVKNLLENFLLIFSSIKNNVPLAVYAFGYSQKKEIDESISAVTNRIKEKMRGDYRESPCLSKEIYIKMLLSLSFYRGIVKVLESLKISKCDWVEINELKQKFTEVYKRFGLNLNNVFLSRDVNNIKPEDMFNAVEQSRSKQTEPNNINIDERNFFAHSGLVTHILDFELTHETEVRYKSEALDTIRKLLRKNV
ncbi:MAG: CRISPR-associated CARF protein Csx1 [Patescibacteria group bacterium]|nr:CRISPR-associated CARF protein Csx1 [Patescibacteria group bacterium]